MTIEERLEKLERENRRVRIGSALIGGAVVLVLLLIGMVLKGAKRTDYSTSDFRFKSVEAEQFTVRDENGKPRATLGVLHDVLESHARLDEEQEMFPEVERFAGEERLVEVGDRLRARLESLRSSRRARAILRLQRTLLRRTAGLTTGRRAGRARRRAR